MSTEQMKSSKIIFSKINKIIKIAFICLSILFSETFAKDNKILLKVNNEIITSVDILNEIEYLSIINDQFRNAERNVQIEIAKNSVVKEKIKMIEILKYQTNLQINEDLLENIIVKNFSSFNVKSLSGFDKFFKGQLISSDFVKNKIIIETLWNQLIYSKFNKNVKINENEIKKSISNKKILKEYLLSEILINFDKNEKVETKIELVKKTIMEKSFSEAALIHSASQTAAKGGKLGWIKENVLNNKIKNEINSTNIGQFTSPIVIPGGILILNKEATREVEKEIDIDNEIKLIIEKKTNAQLNRLSTVYFNKIKKNILINET